MPRWRGSLAALALLSLAALACGGSNTTESVGVPSSFYIEATAFVNDSGEEAVTAVRWWFETPARWRWEFESHRGLFFGVSDGETLSTYSPEDNTYATAPLPPGLDQPALPISIQIGPALADTVGAFLALLIERTEGFADRGGEERVLGYETVIIEYGPLFSSASSDQEGVTRSGVGRMWIDPETMLILRHDIGDDNGPLEEASIVVTRLDLDEDLGGRTRRARPPRRGRPRGVVDYENAAMLILPNCPSSGPSHVTFETPRASTVKGCEYKPGSSPCPTVSLSSSGGKIVMPTS